MNNTIKTRVRSLDSQEVELETLVFVKTYSFLLYLRKTKFKGFTKWCIINRVVQEYHPEKINLVELMNRTNANREKLKQKMKEGHQEEEVLDPILIGLL